MPAKQLLDRNEIFVGLKTGLDVFPISYFWSTLDYYQATGKMNWLMMAYVALEYSIGVSHCILGFSAVFVVDMDLRRGTAGLVDPICGLQSLFKCSSFMYGFSEYIRLLDFLKKNFISCVPKEKEVGARAVAAKNVAVTNRFVKYAMRWNCVSLVMISTVLYWQSQATREFLGIGGGPIYPNKICYNEYPFEWNYTPVYEIIVAFEELAVILAIATASAYQVILLFLVMALVGHLKVLGYVLENLLVEDFAPGNFIRMDDAAQEKAYRQLICCIKDHQKILRAGDDLAKRYNTFLTFHLGTAITVGIVSIFNSVAANTIEERIKFGVSCGYGMVEVAIYCLCGQLLENASEDVLRQVYQCEWEEMNPKFRKAVQLMMVRSNNPICLRAGRLYRVNLETMGMIQQLVYSALTMLLSIMD